MVIFVRRSRLDARLSARRGSARRRCVSWGDRNSNAACRPVQPQRARTGTPHAPAPALRLSRSVLSLRPSFPLAGPLAISLCLSSSCSYTFYYIFLPEPKIPSVLVSPVRLPDPSPLLCLAPSCVETNVAAPLYPSAHPITAPAGSTLA